MEDKQKLADDIINHHVKWSMGAGMVWVPVIDFVAVGSIQLEMIKQLTKLYGHEFKESQTQAIIAALTSSAISKITLRAVKFIPGVGTLLGGIAMSVMSGASTYALGQIFKNHFEKGGSPIDINSDQIKNKYAEFYEYGKGIIEKLKNQYAPNPKYEPFKMPKDEPVSSSPTVNTSFGSRSIVDQLKDIVDLKEKGMLTDEEFVNFKKKILDLQ